MGGTKSRDPNSGASDSTVRSKVAVWQGIAEITCVVAGGIGEFSGAEPHVTADIVEEALCNTVRLGNADAIHRQVTHEVNEGRLCVHVRVNLSKLADIYGLAYQLQVGEADFAAGRTRLAQIAAEPRQWTGWAAAAAWPLVAIGVAALLSGNEWDTILAAPLSLIAYGITVVSSRRGGKAPAWLPLTSAFVVALLGTAAKVAVPEVNIVILTLSAVAILLPGYGISLGIGELVSGRVLSGLTNLADGLVYLLKQVAGGLAGAVLVASIIDVGNAQPTTMDPRWEILFVPLLTLGLLLAFQSAPRDLLPATLAVLLAYVVFAWGMDTWNVNVGVFLSAATITALAILWEARTRRPAVVIAMPVIAFLVSGSIGFRGLASLSSGDVDTAGAQLLQMFTVAVAITAGVMVATALFRRRSTL